MFTITIDEVVNGFVVRAYDTKDGYAINEFCEDKLETLKVLNTYLQKEITKEVERRIYAATL